MALLLVAPAWAQSSASVDKIVRALRGGGYVIVFRHGATNADQADTDPLNHENVARQRHLNDQGRAQARAVGEVFKATGVPTGRRTRAASGAPSRRRA